MDDTSIGPLWLVGYDCNIKESTSMRIPQKRTTFVDLDGQIRMVVKDFVWAILQSLILALQNLRRLPTALFIPEKLELTTQHGHIND